jgi:hypothetical protein
VVLKTVVYQDGQFSFVAAMQFAQAADGYDLRATSSVLRSTTRTISRSQSIKQMSQPLMSGALAQLQRSGEW